MTDIRDIRSPEEARMANEGQQNAGGALRRDDSGRPYYDSAPLSPYPCMLFKKTDVPQHQDWADQLHPGSEEKMVTNCYHGLLCETTIAQDADEAEQLASEGWENTPFAAHGQSDGIAKVATAKDERIAELERIIAERDAEPKRGPGRPPANRDAQA